MYSLPINQLTDHSKRTSIICEKLSSEEVYLFIYLSFKQTIISVLLRNFKDRATSSSNCNIIVLIIKEQEERSQWADIKWIKSSEKPATSFCKILAKWPLPGSWLIEALEGFARCRADKSLGRQADCREKSLAKWSLTTKLIRRRRRRRRLMPRLPSE